MNKRTLTLRPGGPAANSPQREPWEQGATDGFPSRGAATENRPELTLWGNVCRPSGAGKSSGDPMDPRHTPWAIFCRRFAALIGLAAISLAGGAYIAFHVCAPATRATSLSTLQALAGLGFLRVADIKGNVGATRVWGRSRWAAISLLAISLVFLPSCGKVRAKSDSPAAVTVGVTKVSRKTLQRQITLSCELVPFQEH